MPDAREDGTLLPAEKTVVSSSLTHYSLDQEGHVRWQITLRAYLLKSSGKIIASKSTI